MDNSFHECIFPFCFCLKKGFGHGKLPPSLHRRRCCVGTVRVTYFVQVSLIIIFSAASSFPIRCNRSRVLTCLLKMYQDTFLYCSELKQFLQGLIHQNLQNIRVQEIFSILSVTMGIPIRFSFQVDTRPQSIQEFKCRRHFF